MKVWVAAALFLLSLQYPAAAQRQAGTSEPTGGQDLATIRITSPLGRTGLVMRVRIVAQVHIPADTTLSPVTFFVDGQLVGTVNAGPPYSVDWLDDNPFERREIVVQAADGTGRTIRDEVILPPFEVTDRTDVMGVLLETGVYDKAGRMVSTIDAAAFTVKENGVPQKIDQVLKEAIRTNVVLLVDNSQSMSRRIDFVRLACERLARTLHERDRVIVAPFNAHVQTITGPTNDLPTISQAIGAMRAGGGTALLDALLEATQLLESLEGRRLIVLITDGYDENSTVKADEVLEAATRTDETIYAVGVGGVAGISLKGEDLLKRITAQTGGRVFFPPRESDLAPAVDTVAADAHNRFLITYTPANQKKDGTWREVAVEVPVGLRTKTRAGYFAPAAPPIRPAIEFSIMDRQHSYVDITADDLLVSEDGVAQKVDAFQEAFEPVSIVMALDESGSMKKSAELVRSTARDFVNAIRPEDSLGLIMFSNEPKFEHTLATNRQWTLDAIDKYTPDGGTALYDALWNSLMTLKGVPGRHAVVVLTDGRDEDNPGTAPGSTHVLDEVLTLNRQVGATILAVGLGTKVDKQVLERLATDSGGQAYFANDASLLGDQFGRVVENLRRRYVLSYTSTNSNHDGKWRNVQIKPRTAGQIVSTRGGYFAPEQ